MRTNGVYFVDRLPNGRVTHEGIHSIVRYMVGKSIDYKIKLFKGLKGFRRSKDNKSHQHLGFYLGKESPHSVYLPLFNRALSRISGV